MSNVQPRERIKERVARGRLGGPRPQRDRWPRLAQILVEPRSDSALFEAWARVGLMVGIVGAISVVGLLLASSVAVLGPWAESARPYIRGAGAVIGLGAGWLAYARCIEFWAHDI